MSVIPHVSDTVRRWYRMSMIPKVSDTVRRWYRMFLRKNVCDTACLWLKCLCRKRLCAKCKLEMILFLTFLHSTYSIWKKKMSLIRNISDTECLRTKRRRTKCGVKGLWYKTSPHKVLLRKCRGKCRWNKMSPIQTILPQKVSAQNVFKVSETKRLRKKPLFKNFLQITP